MVRKKSVKVRSVRKINKSKSKKSSKNTKKVRIEEKKNLIYDNFKIAINDLSRLKGWLIFSFLLFFTVGFIGFFFPIFYVDEIMDLVRELISQTEDMGGLQLTAFIMVNNIWVSFIAMVFGIFLGIVPVFMSVFNGYVIGFVANKSVAVEGFSVLWRLVPHGIFEIPAILISIGLGIRLGMFLLFYRGKNKLREFWKWVKDSFRIFLLIVIPLLVIAALIEGWLIASFS